jgi:hypothetical protein
MKVQCWKCHRHRSPKVPMDRYTYDLAYKDKPVQSLPVWQCRDVVSCTAAQIQQDGTAIPDAIQQHMKGKS